MRFNQKTTILFIRWRRCLIFNNNNKELNQPKECIELYNLYMNEIIKEKKNMEKYGKK